MKSVAELLRERAALLGRRGPLWQCRSCPLGKKTRKKVALIENQLNELEVDFANDYVLITRQRRDSLQQLPLVQIATSKAAEPLLSGAAFEAIFDELIDLSVEVEGTARLVWERLVGESSAA